MKEGSQATAAPPLELFSVECTTCQARLKVRSSDAIGQILGCPKCHSMVLIAPPADWRPEGTAPPVAIPVDAPIAANAQTAAWKLWAAAAPVALLSLAGVFGLWKQLPDRTHAPIAAEVQPRPETPVQDAAQANATADSPANERTVQEVIAVATENSEQESPPFEESAPMAESEVPPAVQIEAPLADSSAADSEAPAADPRVVANDEPAAESAESASTADDLRRRLQTRVAAIDEPAISLAALTDLLSGLSACPIELDKESLKSIEVTGETETSVKLDNGTIEAALAAALEPLGLSFEPRGKAIVVFAAAP